MSISRCGFTKGAQKCFLMDSCAKILSYIPDCDIYSGVNISEKRKNQFAARLRKLTKRGLKL